MVTGEMVAGEMVAGAVMSGEMVAGAVMSGEMVTGEMVTGAVMSGEMVLIQMLQGGGPAAGVLSIATSAHLARRRQHRAASRCKPAARACGP